MAIVEPGKGRAVIEQNGTGLRITIPARTPIFATIFIALWLIGWAFGEVSVTRQLLAGDPSNGSTLFLAVWMAGWTMGGAWAAFTLAWMITGKEIIDLTSTSLHQRKQIPIFSRSRNYAVAQIRNLRRAPRPRPSDDSESVTGGMSFSDGAISFDYGRSTHHLAAELDDADAEYVIAEMCKRVKSLAASGETGRAWR